MKLITKELEERFKEIGNQSKVKNPLIIAKFFDPVGSGTWYATEYDPRDKICYGYVTGLFTDEWGSFSIDELESIQRPFGLGIERDIHFKEKTFDEQIPRKNQERKSELKRLNSNKDKKQELEH